MFGKDNKEIEYSKKDFDEEGSRILFERGI